jgi:hypothetical protein
MKRKRRHARRAVTPRSARPVAEALSAEALNAESRALLGEQDRPRRMRPAPSDDASVEDPLQDWPET